MKLTTRLIALTSATAMALLTTGCSSNVVSISKSDLEKKMGTISQSARQVECDRGLSYDKTKPKSEQDEEKLTSSCSMTINGQYAQFDIDVDEFKEDTGELTFRYTGSGGGPDVYDPYAPLY